MSVALYQLSNKVGIKLRSDVCRDCRRKHRHPKLTTREIDRINDLCKRTNDLCKRIEWDVTT